MIVQQHPGSPAGSVNPAVDIAAVVIAIRALTGIGSWLWAARRAARSHRRARTASIVALAVSTLGTASSYPYALSTFPVRFPERTGAPTCRCRCGAAGPYYVRTMWPMVAGSDGCPLEAVRPPSTGMCTPLR